MDKLLEAIKCSFLYAELIWNSVNFYTIAISNSHENLDLFVSGVKKAFIPKHFCYEESIPKSL
ncbi:hypothetical protein [Francisella halioticida]|uniref:hypothetical protein n=1 Tax=Francisella halioticida TaxID=549298 RepID=UPI0012FA6E72|nr:hypothetical protein [Francisella halioticida]